MKIAVIYNKYRQFNTAVFIEEIIKAAGKECWHFEAKDSLNIPKDFDLYLRIDHGDYKDDLPKDYHPAVFYAIDTHLKKPYKKIREQAKHYDIVFCAQKQGAEGLKKEAKVETVWLPLGYYSKVIKRMDILRKYDIGFVGRDAQKFARGRYLRLLKKKYPKSFIGRADFRKIAEIYSSSKIGFNPSVNNDINLRIFEIMGSGCFLLTSRIKNNGLEDLFEEGKHLVTFRNEKDLIEVIDYYLKNEEERERISQEGFRLVSEKHTLFCRVQAMFNYIAFKFGGKYNTLRI